MCMWNDLYQNIFFLLVYKQYSYSFFIHLNKQTSLIWTIETTINALTNAKYYGKDYQHYVSSEGSHIEILRTNKTAT